MIDIREDKNKENNNGYWYPDDVYPYILEFLKKEFPGRLIIREFNKIDIMVLDESLPIEIQRTYSGQDYVHTSEFEDRIRRQIEQNVEISGRCWLFFDAKFLKYLQSDLGRQVSINMDWLYQYKKKGKVRVFTVTYNGIIKEMSDADFSFLPKTSTTCKTGKEEDFRILEKNKSNIALNVLKGYGFTTDEMNDMRNSYKAQSTEYDKFDHWLNRKERTEREYDYANIFRAIGNLENINRILNCACNTDRTYQKVSGLAFHIGIFGRNKDDVRGTDKYVRIYFADKYNIAQYFPGYIRKKELWDYLRTHNVSQKTFYAIIRGETDYLWWIKNQTTIEEAWNS